MTVKRHITGSPLVIACVYAHKRLVGDIWAHAESVTEKLRRRGYGGCAALTHAERQPAAGSWKQ